MAALSAIVADILSDATKRLGSMLSPRPAERQENYYDSDTLVTDAAPAVELVRVCYATQQPTLLPAVLRRIHRVASKTSKTPKQRCMADHLLVPFLSKLQVMVSKQAPPVEDISGLKDLALLAVTLDVKSMTYFPDATKLDQLISRLVLGGGSATTIKTL